MEKEEEDVLFTWVSNKQEGDVDVGSIGFLLLFGGALSEQQMFNFRSSPPQESRSLPRAPPDTSTQG